MASYWRAARCVAAVSLSAATTAAQGSGVRFGFGTGLAMPVGDYHATAGGDGFNTGWQPMAFVAFTPQIVPALVRLDVTYGVNDANDQLNSALTTSIGQPASEKAKLLGLNADLVYPAASAAVLHPYLVGGIGVYHATISLTVGDSTPSDAATKFAWNLGGGLSYELRGIALFLEARYVNVAAVAGYPRTTLFPITTGVRFGGR